MKQPAKLSPINQVQRDQSEQYLEDQIALSVSSFLMFCADSNSPSRLTVLPEGKREGLPLPPRCRDGANSPHLPACGFPTSGRPPTYCPHIVASADAFVLHTAEAFSDPSVKEKELTLNDTNLFM